MIKLIKSQCDAEEMQTFLFCLVLRKKFSIEMLMKYFKHFYTFSYQELNLFSKRQVKNTTKV